MYFLINDEYMPTVAVEVGWSESQPQLYNDINLLLVGSGSIRVVILVKWSMLQGGRVSGVAEVFMRDRNGVPKLVQSEVCSRLLVSLSYTYYLELVQIIFPRPADGENQVLRIRRGDLFGRAMLAGRNPNDILPLRLDRLRYIVAGDHAAGALRRMKLVPA
jgi:hypothetical protein